MTETERFVMSLTIDAEEDDALVVLSRAQQELRKFFLLVMRRAYRRFQRYLPKKKRDDIDGATELYLLANPISYRLWERPEVPRIGTLKAGFETYGRRDINAAILRPYDWRQQANISLNGEWTFALYPTVVDAFKHCFTCTNTYKIQMTMTMMTMPMATSSVSVYLVNETEEAIAYQALGDTEPRILAVGDSVTLQNLSVPATVTFSYETPPRDRQTGSGLTKALLTAESNNSLLKLAVQPTADLDSEVSNLTVESTGNVFVL